MNDLLRKFRERASLASKESKYVDFKAEVDITSTRDWCEIIKDLVAMANSGGGVIVFGVRNDGTPSEFDAKPILQYDPADLTNKMFSYTGYQFADFEICPIDRSSKTLAAVVVGSSEVPMTFIRPGTYPISDKEQRTAFARGTVYFRHGAKSEPATTDDFRQFVERRIESVRKTWLAGIKKVTQAPAGATISVVDPTPATGRMRGRIVSDRRALPIVPENADEVWPHRQIDVIKEVNKRLKKGVINSHDVLCVRRVFKIDSQHPEFVYRPYQRSSPQYSDAFVDWLTSQYQADPTFFTKARNQFKRITK